MSSVIASTPSGDNFLKIQTEGEELNLPIIPATKAHRSYILSTWVKSYVSVVRNGHANVDLSIYLREEPKVAEALWHKSLVISGENDPFIIHGWICSEPNILHFVYIPPELRGKGIAKALTYHYAGPSYEYGRRWPFKKAGLIDNGVFNPYILGRSHGGS